MSDLESDRLLLEKEMRRQAKILGLPNPKKTTLAQLGQAWRDKKEKEQVLLEKINIKDN